MFPTTNNSSTNLASMLAETKVAESNTSQGKAFLKFDFKSGDFAYGRDAEEITGETIVINTYSIQHGWTLWANGAPKKVSAPFNAELPEPMAPVDGNSPTESRSFEACFQDDPDTILVFDSNSHGGRTGVNKVLDQIKARAVSGEGEYLFPKVKLSSDSYKSKQGATVHNPVFKIVGWLNLDGEEQSSTAKLEDNLDDSMIRRRRKA
tara:strand:+ start:6079 stop:6699 length:621 start_codon:yes stop_codon:yes gene_type:complete